MANITNNQTITDDVYVEDVSSLGPTVPALRPEYRIDPLRSCDTWAVEVDPSRADWLQIVTAVRLIVRWRGGELDGPPIGLPQLPYLGENRFLFYWYGLQEFDDLSGDARFFVAAISIMGTRLD